ncbi:MAG: tyrosine-protein phosphatase [Bacteroidota bacterium]|nr:tyrosine-protein phosphatase [Bacteroidota bacterium]
MFNIGFKTVSFYTILTLLCSCATKQNLEIKCVCEEGLKHQDTIKWEVFPETEGLVQIFSSDSPDEFDLTMPLTSARVSDRMSLVPRLDGNRKYFMLLFDNKQQVYVTNRKINVSGVYNFRDIGGYTNDDDRILKWGKVYRSGSLTSISDNGEERLKDLHIKTIIDLRTDEERQKNPDKIKGARVIGFPMKNPICPTMEQRLLEGKCMRNDAVIYMQDLFSGYASQYDKEFTRLFNYLSRKENYPVLIHCSNGNDRTGFVTAMIMQALGMPEDEIYEDYLFSNDCINIRNEVQFGDQLPSEGQEALTILLSAQKDFLQYAFEKIRQENGSMDKYLQKKLKLSPRKKEKIQRILLTR